MNKNYTLKELAEIYMGSPMPESACTNTVRAGIQKVLDAIGYEFPKDEELEAFDRWLEKSNLGYQDTFFEIWKAGREELRRAQLLDKQPAEPAWIPWEGGECPLGDGVEFEFKIRDGGMSGRVKHAPMYNWGCRNSSEEIVAYRVFEG